MGIVSGRIRKQIFRKCDGRCAYCGMPVAFPAMQVDHLLPTYWNWSDEECLTNKVIRGTDNYENLMPSCRRCNKWKTDLDIEVLRDKIKQQPKALLDFIQAYTLPAWDGLFYFERMPGFSKSPIRLKQ